MKLSRRNGRVPDEEPSDQDTSAPDTETPAPTLKGRRSLSRMRRELTDEEADNSGVRKILMDDVDRLEGELAQLQPYVDKFHEADKDNAVLKEKAKVRVMSDIAFGTFMSVGSAILGLSVSLHSIAWAILTAIIIGAVLIIAGIFSKVVLK